MGTYIAIEIIVLVVLILLSGFFSASETALMSLSKIRLKHMVESNVKNANKIEELLDRPDKMLGSILLGNNAVNIAATSVATALVILLFPNGRGGVAFVTAIMTVLILVFGEITPKSLAVEYTEKISLFVARPILFLSKLFSPLIFLLTKITAFIIRLFGGEVNVKKPFITTEELRTLVDVSSQEGILEHDEKEMIYNIFEFSDLRIKDVMVQRMDMLSVPIDATYAEVIEMFNSKKFSRLPVYDDTIDNIVGILYSKDLFFKDVTDGISPEEFSVKDYMREPFNTFEFIKINDFFKQMQGNRNHLAIVLDEYGGVAGLVTMEDIVESIFGEINDEFDEIADSDVEVVKEDEYIVNGNIRLDELNELINTNFESEEFESFGGFIIGLLGRLPKSGEIIHYSSYQFVVENVEKNRINKVRIFT
ncbi:MAG: hemolysin family protein [Peptostreptococcaceae bacterium]|nr:hemolysin family protein [Peptostreptococcaceae bacterium]